MSAQKCVICVVALTMWFGTTAHAQVPDQGYIRVSDGVQLSYRLLGDGGPSLVIIHGQAPGYVTDSYVRSFEPLASHFRVIFYDRRGNGRSTWLTDPELLTVAKHVEDLDAVRRYFDLDRMMLLGESLGAGVTALYAVEHTEHVSV